MEDQKTKVINNLRKMADYLEARSFEIGESDMLWTTCSIYLSCESVPTFKANIKKLGGFTKSAGSDLQAEVKVGECNFQVYIARSKVCKRVVTGKKTIPAVAAVPAVPEREEDIIEYKCPKSFHDIPDNISELIRA